MQPLYNTNPRFYWYLSMKSDMGFGRMDLDTQIHGVSLPVYPPVASILESRNLRCQPDIPPTPHVYCCIAVSFFLVSTITCPMSAPP